MVMTAKRIITNTKYQPFLKWVGGKRQLLSQLIPLLPKDINNYHEPFLGGGAMFFELFEQGYLEGKKTFISDINSELINTYQVVKKYPEKLILELKKFASLHSNEFYYQIREWDRKEDFFNTDEVLRATRFIYLNKTCFNGLYRVNKSNQNNVPIGKYKNPNICDEVNIYNSSLALQDAIITNMSYENSIKNIENHDFLYLDPPYYPVNETSNFTSYDANNFLAEEQCQLHKFFTKCSKIAHVMQSNSDTDFIKNLYENYEINTIMASRFINSKSDKRGKISEIAIRNYNEKI